MKTLTLELRIIKIIKNHGIQFEKNENYENHRIQLENHDKKNKNLKVPLENTENHENIGIPKRI